MPYINTIDVNGTIYNLENLTDGKYVVDLPDLNGPDIFLLRGDVVDSLTDFQTKKPLSANQGRVLSEKINAEIARATGELNNSIATLESTVESNKSTSDTSVSSLRTYADDTFIKKANIADNLTTNSSDKVLSAKQGKLLNDNKVDKMSGKGLSTNDYTTVEKNKLSAIEEGANKYVHPEYTAQSSGLYKIIVDSTGHVSAVTLATKDDITALGIPAQDTVYTLPQASSTEIGGVKIDSDYVLGADDVAASTAALNAVYESLKLNIDNLSSKCDALSKRIEALEKQNPEATV